MDSRFRGKNDPEPFDLVVPAKAGTQSSGVNGRLFETLLLE